MATASTASPVDEGDAGISTASKQSSRQLACTICQQRKIKCNRKYPCSHCLKSGAADKCMPASLVQRRRRFPEKQLLDRLRQYEDLLRQNNVPFESLHPSAGSIRQLGTQEESHDSWKDASSAEDASRGSAKMESRTIYETKDIDDADDGVTRTSAIKELWNHTYHNSSHLFFGLRQNNLDLAALHPMPAHIFKLWQIYLDNIDPLLKVTHAPSLQARIIEAMADVSEISSDLEALMFSIYCVAVFSIDDEKSRQAFGTAKDELLNGYQFACQQALLNSAFLRSVDRDCLTALYLFLISFMSSTDAHSLSSMMAITKRIAERMGIHDEAKNTRRGPFEAEMRRRLWWSLVLFDNRQAETSETRTAMLSPIWDCKIPANVADLDLRPDMKSVPTSSDMPTEALFVVARAEFGDAIRKSLTHIDFVQPSLRSLCKQTGLKSLTDEFVALEKSIEDRFVRRCSEEVPLHFVTIWMLRSLLAKSHLLELKSREARPVEEIKTLQHREAAVQYALRNLEADTKLMSSELIARFRWYTSDYFPLPAYMNIIQELRQTPGRADAEKLWRSVDENYEARFVKLGNHNWVVMRVMSSMITQAWEALQACLESQGKPPQEPPRIVSDVLAAKLHVQTASQSSDGPQTHAVQAGLAFSEHGHHGMGPITASHPAVDLQMDQHDWTGMDFDLMHTSGW